MRSDSVKVFKDPVHGYIEVPAIIVKNLIDTDQFQRLKFIEQTSMRALFPAARHDRFVHSLGTYWLGKKAFEGFQKNSRPIILELKNANRLPKNKKKNPILTDEWWKKYELLFQIACLMHDCAHAPFSHTLEDYYTIPQVVKGSKRYSTLSWKLNSECEALKDRAFRKDFFTSGTKRKLCYYGVGKPHEQMSAYVILTNYRSPIKTVFEKCLPKIQLKDEDYVFICRAIIGCKYSNKSAENSIKNCIISLLNSELIDVDGLDYIVRDAQMSGMSAYDIDYQRLLNSFTILPINVFNGEICEDINIDGLWLKESTFHAKSIEQCTVDTDVLLITSSMTYRDRLMGEGCKPFEADPLKLTFKPESNKTTARIDGIPEIEMKLLASGRLTNARFSGTIEGKRVIENDKDIIEGRDISFVLAYDKRCLSIIQNTINARNDEYLWVYSHPKVLYCANYLQCELLKLSAKYLCCKCNNEDYGVKKLTFHCENCKAHTDKNKNYEQVITNILGYDFLLNEAEDLKIKDLLQKKGFYFSRTSDDDLNALFKRVYLENSFLGDNKSDRISKISEEYFSRKHKSVLWKSYFEYMAICKMLDDSSAHRNFDILFEDYGPDLEDTTESYLYLNETDQKIFEKCGCTDEVILIFSKANTKSIKVSEFFVKYEDRVEQLSKLNVPNTSKGNIALGLRFLFADEGKKWSHSALRELNDLLETRSSKK